MLDNYSYKIPNIIEGIIVLILFFLNSFLKF
ncbi:hypothetical protein BB050_01765 [Flavobacterium anhuiense]|uniref:Uncharacterized protein n=1 Tax=Flavobacterium anhuiense TaxID=459526 RepID=A0AAC9CZ83_9FLAO|nr:hypothetical protein BB050_01765 [Flavobacterium anhuiense]